MSNWKDEIKKQAKEVKPQSLTKEWEGVLKKSGHEEGLQQLRPFPCDQCSMRFTNALQRCKHKVLIHKVPKKIKKRKNLCTPQQQREMASKSKRV